MTIKNVIQEVRIPANQYTLTVQPGVGTVVLVSIGGLEKELDAPELPDRTVRSGGRGKPVETDIVQPMHHSAEVAVMELWWGLCENSILGYLKLGVLVQYDASGLIPLKRWQLPNAWLKKMALSDLEMEGDGEMSTITWTLQADDLIALP
jgi:hypothetical protein